MFKILIDILHPAHVFLFKNAILAWRDMGVKIILTSREKDITTRLLDELKFEHKVLSSKKTGIWGLIKELLIRDVKLYKIVKAEKPNLLIGTSTMIAHVSRVTPPKSIIFEEDDANVKKLISGLGYPFADYICTPDCLQEDHGKKHVKYNSYHELAYLHPNNFKPDPYVLSELNLKIDEPFFLLRFVSLEASHDINEKGMSISLKEKIVNVLLKFGKVFISNERQLPQNLKKYEIQLSPLKMHSLLYFATMFIGDSQTMTAEAAVLGTPAIRNNSFVGRISYLEDLEYKYGLTYGFYPGQEKAMISKINELLNLSDLKNMWQKKREKMLSEKVDFNKWMINFVNRFND